jgi:hypothetical protein
MTDTRQLAIEIRYVPLPADELEERRARLRTLLLRGALRLIRQQVPGAPSPNEVDFARVIQK